MASSCYESDFKSNIYIVIMPISLAACKIHRKSGHIFLTNIIIILHYFMFVMSVLVHVRRFAETLFC